MKNGYLLMFLAGQEVKNPLASKLASAFWPFDPGIISYYYKKSCFSNIIRVCWWYLTPYIKKERYQCISRYHQNIRSYVGIIQIRYMGRSSELPLSLSNKLPASFTKFSIIRLRKNVNINIKIYPVIFWSLIFWSQMQVSWTNCILQ